MAAQLLKQPDIPQNSYDRGSSFVVENKTSKRLRTFLFGYPIAHSMAPLLHSTLFTGLKIPWTYDLMESQDASKFLPALKQPDVIGCAVTMPYKVTMMSAVDEVTEDGRMVGAINTVFLRKGEDGRTKYIGTNTDCTGVREAFLQNFPAIQDIAAGRPALVIGGGGACRAAVYSLWKWFGVSKIYMVNRLESEVLAVIESFQEVGFTGNLVWVGSEEQAHELDAPVLVVGTVPDFPPKEKGEILAKNISDVFLNKENKGYVLEMCYHPNPHTAFFDAAERKGWKVLSGTESMIYQGVAQQVLWTNLPLERFCLDEAKSVIEVALAKH